MHDPAPPLDVRANPWSRALSRLAVAGAPLLLAACATSPYGQQPGGPFGQTVRDALQAQSLAHPRDVGPAPGVTHGELEPGIARLRAWPASQGSGPGAGAPSSPARPMLP